MIYMTDGADIYMGLCPLKLFFGHCCYLLN
jgi:hypothetical protein